MLKLKKILLSGLIGFVLAGFMSCKSEITLTALPDGSTDLKFSGECGKYFESMIRQFSENDNEVLFDAMGIKQSFTSDGFKNVNVRIPSSTGIDVEMNSPCETYLYTSGLISNDNKEISVTVTPEILSKFYKSADEEIVNILDLLLAPVFNDEEMTEEEYLETLASFYGSDASDEIGPCNIKLTLINVDGQKKEASIPLTKLLCLQGRIKYSTLLN